VSLLLAIGGGLLLFTIHTVRQVEAALPPAGRFVDVPGARLHVVERGQGPSLLLVHGLAGQLCHFTYAIVDELATHYRVVTVVELPLSNRTGRGLKAADKFTG
jgi:hypothetical protein